MAYFVLMCRYWLAWHYSDVAIKV